MERFVIKGGKQLEGNIKVHGAKNSSLPILVATVLTGEESVIHNCPELTDIDATIKILMHLGCSVHRFGSTVTVNSKSLFNNSISDELMHEMRSSFVFMGALLGRTGEAKMSAPGGCEIGLRPVDLHLFALKQMDVDIKESYGRITCRSNEKIKGAKINLSFPSVGATENIILAAVMADGTTTIVNAAREPEITDLADYLVCCGAKISGAGESVITIEGVEELHGCEYKVMPDRIVTASYMAAAAVTGSSILISGTKAENLSAVISVFEQSGCNFKIDKSSILISAPKRLKKMENIITMPYPGFPTDCQALLMAMASVANGTTVIKENIFENRFNHASQLIRMGADIDVHGRVAVVQGVEKLEGTHVYAPDLRGGFALIIAGLCANGNTTVSGINFVDRGYEKSEVVLSELGADIKREFYYENFESAKTEQNVGRQTTGI